MIETHHLVKEKRAYLLKRLARIPVNQAAAKIISEEFGKVLIIFTGASEAELKSCFSSYKWRQPQNSQSIYYRCHVQSWTLGLSISIVRDMNAGAINVRKHSVRY